MVPADREVSFHLSPNRIYYFDTVERENIVLMLNTVSENWECFLQREYDGAQEAQREMHLLGFPSERDFENIVR